MKAKALKVDIEQAEKLRKKLIEKKILRKDLKILKNKKFVYLPINSNKLEDNSFSIIQKDFKKYKKKVTHYRDFIILDEKLKDKLPNSYDIVGNIALLKIKNNLLNYKEIIGKAILNSNKNINTVCQIYPIKGEYRKREIEIIAGIKQTKTTHHEYGIKIYIDINKAYFSPRLANERKRISEKIKPKEIILDMFSGVAPFSLMIAKYSSPKIIYSNDKNKDAIKIAKLNVKLNNLLDKIEILCEDARYISKYFKKKDIQVDRIIMNLPHTGYKYFKSALEIAAKNCIIHYYDILSEEKIEKRKKYLIKISDKMGYKLKFSHVNKIKSYSPREFYIGFDITAKKNADVA